MTNDQLWAHFDALQHKQAELEARVDALAQSMNAFCTEARGQLEALGFVKQLSKENQQ